MGMRQNEMSLATNETYQFNHHKKKIIEPRIEEEEEEGEDEIENEEEYKETNKSEDLIKLASCKTKYQVMSSLGSKMKQNRFLNEIGTTTTTTTSRRSLCRCRSRNRSRNKQQLVSISASFLVFIIICQFTATTLNYLYGNEFTLARHLNWPQQVAAITASNTISGLQQSMAQLLQVFNGNESQAAEFNHFRLMEIYGDFLLLGARLEWPPSDEDTRMCRVKGKSIDQCQNYIRVLKQTDDRTLLVCGTNAYKPRCRTYIVTNNAYELADESPGEGACPYQENQNVTSLFVDGHLYSAFAAQFSGFDGLIHRIPLRTEQFNPKQLNSPNFVSSFRYGEHVYFLFRESAIEHINCGKTVYSRIARVCINDSGGQTRANRERWTSFTKARLNCSIPSDYPFYFDQIQAATGVVSSASAGSNQAGGYGTNPATDMFYAVFTTPPNSIGGSAVCAFRMSDVLAAFDGPFKAQADSNSNWLPVPESKVPQPRPGTCVNDSKRLPDEHINFIKDNPLMDQPVEALWSQPLIMMASINFRFTQIAVDPQVETSKALGAQMMRTDVIFVGTDDGRAFKLTNTHHIVARSSNFGNGPQYAAHHAPYPQQNNQRLSSNGLMNPYASALTKNQAQTGPLSPQSLAISMNPNNQQSNIRDPPPFDVSSNTLVIEELHLFDARTPIMNMLIYHRPDSHPLAGQPGSAKLLVLSSKQLKAIPLSRCERAITCADCLALYDPYCAWDTRAQNCHQVGRSMAANVQASQSPTEQPYYHSPSVMPAPSSANPNANWFASSMNQTLAWWSQCPAATNEQSSGSQVGPPFRSLFSSHLQVPSRFDYASGHYLAHPSIIALSSPLANPNSMTARQQPASECLTFCGGLYTPQGVIPASGDPSNGQTSSSSCADYVQQHYLASANSFNLGGQQQGSSSLYTSENLYFAVIICALCSLIFGLLFGFALGRSAKKPDSSICSSTFDETNLYMASTGSHTARNIFAPHNQNHLHQHHPLIQQQQQHQMLSNGNGFRQNANGLFETNQSLLTDSMYGNGQQDQLLLALAGSNGSNNRIQSNLKSNAQNSNLHPSGTVRSGALPPIPIQTEQMPLVNNSNTHISHSQLTPNSLMKAQQALANNTHNHHPSMSISSGASSTNTSCSTSATATASDHQNQLYLNQQQLLFQQQQQQQQLNSNRALTNGQQDSIKSKNQAFQAPQAQLQQNKIFL